MDSTFIKKEPKEDNSSSAILKQLSNDKSENGSINRANNNDIITDTGGRDSDSASDSGSNSNNSDDDDDMDGDSDVYEVEEVVGHRMEDGKLSYHIKWKGYPDEESTWENEKSVFCTEMVRDYWRVFIDLGGKRGDLSGSIPRKSTEILSVNGKRKSTSDKDSKATTSTSNNKYNDNGGGKSGKMNGKSGKSNRSGRTSPEPLLPDLSPLVKSSAAAAVASIMTTTTGTQGTSNLTNSKRARTKSPERLQPTQQPLFSGVQQSRRNSTTLIFTTPMTSQMVNTAKAFKATSESSKGSASDDVGSAVRTAIEHSSGDISKKQTAVKPMLTTDESWMPPEHWNSWDEYVERVEAIETRNPNQHDRSTMLVYLRWKGSSRMTLHPLLVVHEKAPRRLIDFYEDHLQFQEYNY
ncbi:hypothetical protein FBU30_003372 [Linnemannia zychae]|nr:hypothetical protein FBU30_003372 [Linnemannia zychae]